MMKNCRKLGVCFTLVSIISLVISNADASELYNLTSWWLFDAGSVSVAYDSTDDGHDDTLFNMDDSDWVSGKIDNCLEFDGIIDKVRIYDVALSDQEIANIGLPFSGGDGTEFNPYLISTPDQLQYFSVNSEKYQYSHFKMIQDIDLQDVLISEISYFSGVFNGNEYTIYNYQHSSEDLNNARSSDNYGLFGCLCFGGEINNLTLVNPSIVCSTYSGEGGLLVHSISASGGKITNCHVMNGYIKIAYQWPSNYGGPRAGGLISYVNRNGIVENCSVIGTTVIGGDAGGLVGENRGIIRNCVAFDVQVEGSWYAGGICGTHIGDMIGCAAEGNITAKHTAGGLIGNIAGPPIQDHLYDPIVQQCYAICNVTSDEFSGGLSGSFFNTLQVVDCFSFGTSNGTQSAGLISLVQSVEGVDQEIRSCYSATQVLGVNRGGLVESTEIYGDGSPPNPVIDSFWDINTSGVTVSDGGTGKTTVEMQTQSTFTNWDFQNAWYMAEYPILQWQVNPLQLQIDAAIDGDEIVVEPGVYEGQLNMKGKNITLKSIDPSDLNIVSETILKGIAVGSVVTFNGTENANCILAGFTITGGLSAGNGGGVSGNGTNAGIIDCVIENNMANSGGGVADCQGNIEGCTIRDNTATENGGGLENCNGYITNCVLNSNSAYCGGGINNCDGTIINCTIVHNNAAKNGGGIRQCDGTITNCIVWKNSFDDIFEGVALTYSCYPDAIGTGNIDTDPLFIAPENDNYNILPDSPCIDAGDPGFDYSNEPFPNGDRINMGAYGNTSQAALSRNGLIPLGFEIIQKNRIGRTVFEYELAVILQNTNDYAMNDVQLLLVEADAAVLSVTDDQIVIPSIDAGQILTCEDTFSLTIDRSYSILTGRLTWKLTYYLSGETQSMPVSLVSMELSEIDSVPGDITGEGDVNLEDFMCLSRQWQKIPGTPSADIAIPLDNFVGIEDLLYLGEHWLGISSY